jgi:hypothetical protein
MPGDSWTIGDGVRDVLRFLTRRAPFALALWLVLGAATLAWANAGAVAGGFGSFGALIALVATLAGVPVGLTLARGLLDAVHFTGWIPATLAGAVAAVVVLAGWLLLRAVLGAADAHLGAIVVVMAVIGAWGAVAKSTWAES